MGFEPVNLLRNRRHPNQLNERTTDDVLPLYNSVVASESQIVIIIWVLKVASNYRTNRNEPSEKIKFYLLHIILLYKLRKKKSFNSEYFL